MNTVIITALFSAVLALVLGIALGIFRKVFHVKEDVLVAAIRGTLPGANCGACGFPGCDGFAAALAERHADPARCSVSSAADTEKRAQLLGSHANAKPVAAYIGCAVGRGDERAKLKGRYEGIPTCKGEKTAVNGAKRCAWGCIGFGDCAKVCVFGAITMKDGLPVIDAEKCRGCKACIAACPQGVIRAVEKKDDGSLPRGAFAVCNCRNSAKPQVKKDCAAGCIKCEICVKKCPALALSMKNGIPETDYTKCTACGVCVAACPQHVLVML